MTLTRPTADELRTACRQFLDDRIEPARLDTGQAEREALWAEITGLGWPSVLIPSELGGMGWGWPEASIVAEELGRSLAPLPFLTNALVATCALSETDHAESSTTLRGIAAGGLRVAVAGMEADSGSTESTLIEADRRGRLTGRTEFVLDAEQADRVIAVARREGKAVLAIADTRSVDVEPLDLVDPSRTAASLVFDDTAAVVVADGARAERAATAIQRAAALGLSCDALGGAGIVVEQAVDYAKARVQFGRPIGSFQAVKHRLANLYVLLQGMNAIVGRAVRHDELWDQGDGGPSALTDGSVDSVAHAYCSGAYARIAGEAILVHGAIGFTWEHRLHRHLKRALLNQHLAGPVRLHRLRHLGTRLNSLGVAC